MPDKKTLARARKDKREGKSASTQAGEFVHEEIEHIRTGKHGARSTKQVIAIALSKARRAGVKLPPPAKGTTSHKVREQAERDLERGKHPGKAPNPKRSRAMTKKLKGEGHQVVSSAALSRHARASAKGRTAP
jgi:predicted house-cleaning NTP pyrophosphatase (Maf/HAM1 superfamily)